eukprot:m.170689 g.170689  ORF g.170689 m.170689 type:complete len:52 (+) comp14536_c0_seq3:4221-4376(+)
MILQLKQVIIQRICACESIWMVWTECPVSGIAINTTHNAAANTRHKQSSLP